MSMHDAGIGLLGWLAMGAAFAFGWAMRARMGK